MLSSSSSWHISVLGQVATQQNGFKSHRSTKFTGMLGDVKAKRRDMTSSAMFKKSEQPNTRQGDIGAARVQRDHPCLRPHRHRQDLHYGGMSGAGWAWDYPEIHGGLSAGFPSVDAAQPDCIICNPPEDVFQHVTQAQHAQASFQAGRRYFFSRFVRTLFDFVSVRSVLPIFRSTMK